MWRKAVTAYLGVGAQPRGAQQELQQIEPQPAHATSSTAALDVLAAARRGGRAAEATALAPGSAPGKRSRLRLTDDALVVIGMYSRTCEAVDNFAAACIGCSSNDGTKTTAVRIVAIVDELEAAAMHVHAPCRGAHHTHATSDLVPEYLQLRVSHHLLSDSQWQSNAAVASTLNLSKLRALMRVMIASFPSARFFMKVDTDTLLNIPQLRRTLLWHVATPSSTRAAAAASPLHLGVSAATAATTAAATNPAFAAAAAATRVHPTGTAAVAAASSTSAAALHRHPHQLVPDESHLPDYIGRAIKLFNFDGVPLIFMQGSAVAFSPRAAKALASWDVTSKSSKWLRCPNRHLRDTHNHTKDKQMRRTCFIRETSSYAEDLYTGILMLQRNYTPAHHSCMLNVQAPLGDGAITGKHLRKLLLSRLARCAHRCPISVHPLKTNATLWKVRRMFAGCAAA